MVLLQVVDVNGEAASKVATEITQAGGEAVAVQCDVTSDAEQERAFDRHMQRYGRLDYALLNAGIAERGEPMQNVYCSMVLHRWGTISIWLVDGALQVTCFGPMATSGARLMTST
jgi:NAD(P)-dependent dehydrogenase (short-subunit alcohol dehydrogenase family)